MPLGTNTEESNPCFKEQQLSFQCFDKNNYDKDKCLLQIENYKTCKKFWGELRRYRRRQGLYPLLPPLEERDKIKQEYLSSKNHKH
ncbi:hypothetical protein ABEB36_006900 [Hypothenemus hampei]|uniref:Coiled-coil-helix-coiled-coil-helix domain-containing protein 7 n=1 Tax=Hypothenemus hampei TaxID=57062 RepID=A0ABD1ES32_HYPHA